MPRPQFTLRSLLVAMLVVGAFFGGAAWQRSLFEIQEVEIETVQSHLDQAIAANARLGRQNIWLHRQIIGLDPTFFQSDENAAAANAAQWDGK